ncbi:hypothetical protein CIB48_g8512 [Xylaria polymorpha]|nr:hypothetical protein CIB48_g8512 [Xylaria polymorpha]
MRRSFSTFSTLPSRGSLGQVILSPGGPRRCASTFQQALAATSPRTTWTRDEISDIYNQPLMELASAAGNVHRRFHKPSAVQLCTLMNIKTGGCTEDCSYCAQSSRYSTGLVATKLSTVDSVLEAAKVAKENGSNRFCMGAAWRDMRGRKRGIQNIVEMIKGVRAMGMEACVTLGMLDKEQARQLKEAGLTAYNHNLDTSREHYSNIITTRSYDERLQTIENVREAGIHVCSGGILGLGEVPETDHVGLIHTLATLPEHPESFPVNKLVPIKGTPMFGQEPVKLEDLRRVEVTMPESEQMLCFMAGANAIFTGEKMLTTDCNGWDEDKAMFSRWGLEPLQTDASKVTGNSGLVHHSQVTSEVHSEMIVGERLEAQG